MQRPNTLKAILVAAFALVALVALPGVAAAKDRNHDRIPDRWEKRHHLTLKKNQARRDQDRDRLRNRAEYLAGSDPRDQDSDNDGVKDGNENAGTVESFDPQTGELTVTLFGGGSITGLVTSETEIDCEGHGGARSSSEGEDTGASEEPDGEDEESDDDGDQHSDQPQEQGDDDGEGSEHSDGPSGGDHPDAQHVDCPSDGNCTIAEGDVVREAELRLSDGQAVFEEIELAD